MRDLAGVTTLRKRRVQACDKFGKNCLDIPRFLDWFPLRNSGRLGNRGGETYKEEFARCDRLRNSPIFFMQRRLNGKEGKRYGDRNRIYQDTETDHI